MAATAKILKKPVLLVAALVVCLIMLRLGVWQLDRAQQKQLILDQATAQTLLPPVSLDTLLAEKDPSDIASLTFRQVVVVGRYLADHSIFIDNQVVNSRVGYWLMTPFRNNAGATLMVKRGWLPVGISRDVLPTINTPGGEQKLVGRLVNPVSSPPLWDPQYPVSKGRVWQYLPLPQFEQQTGLSILPLVLELAPDSNAGDGLLRQWLNLDEKSVAKHNGYAFQWFAMAATFFVACLIVLMKSIKQAK